MSDDVRAVFLEPLAPAVRATANRLIAVVDGQGTYDAAIKWRQLTFAIGSDFDHWLCAVAATRTHARMVFHFGAWLDAPPGTFDAAEAQFVRRITYRSAEEVDDGVLRDLLTQAVDALPRFRARRRDPARPDRRRS